MINPIIRLMGIICSEVKPTSKANSCYFDLEVTIQSSSPHQVRDRYRIFCEAKAIQGFTRGSPISVEGMPRLKYSKETGTQFSVAATTVSPIKGGFAPPVDDGLPF